MIKLLYLKQNLYIVAIYYLRVLTNIFISFLNNLNLSSMN